MHPRLLAGCSSRLALQQIKLVSIAYHPFIYAYKLEVGVAEREMAGRRLDRVKPFSDEQCCRLKAHNILNCKVWWNCGTNV